MLQAFAARTNEEPYAVLFGKAIFRICSGPSQAMGCTDEMFQALAIPLLEQHGASGHTAKLLAQEQWGKGVEECKKQMTPKKRSGIGKNGWWKRPHRRNRDKVEMLE